MIYFSSSTPITAPATVTAPVTTPITAPATTTATVTATVTAPATTTATVYIFHTGTPPMLFFAICVADKTSIACNNKISATSQGNLHASGFFTPSIASWDNVAAP